MVDTFPWQQRMFKVYKENDVVLVVNCQGGFLNTIFEIRLIFIVSIGQIITLKSYLKVNNHVSKLFFVEFFNIISKLQSNNEICCRQLKCPCISEKSGTCGHCIRHFKVTEEQVNLSTPLGTPRVYINSSFLVYFDGHH